MSKLELGSYPLFAPIRPQMAVKVKTKAPKAWDWQFQKGKPKP